MDRKQILLINWILVTCKLIEYNVSYYISLLREMVNNWAGN